MVDPMVQNVLAGVLGAGALGAGYVTFNTKQVWRAVGWFLLGDALAVAAVAVLGGGGVEMTFVALAALVLVSALFAIRIESLMHATMMLTATFVGIAGIFLTLGAEFLAAIQVLVYVGAIITLVLFTVMLTAPSEGEADLKDLELPFGVTVESVEALQSAKPAFTGVGPYKGLQETNPRKPTRVPATLEGVLLKDDVVGTAADPAPQPKQEGSS